MGIFFILAGAALLRQALVLTLFRLFLAILGGYLFTRFRIYIITNKRLVELKAEKIVREVNLDEIAKMYDFKAIGDIIDFVSLVLTGTPGKGFIPLVAGIDNLYIRDTTGRKIFVFKRVRVKEVREKIAEALRELAESKNML